MTTLEMTPPLAMAAALDATHKEMRKRQITPSSYYDTGPDEIRNAIFYPAYRRFFRMTRTFGEMPPELQADWTD